MHDIITIGAATRDLFILSDKFKIIDSPEFATGKGECVSLGSKIEVDRVEFTTGGGATNAAATFAALGFDAAAACKVGSDPLGDEVVDEIAKHGIDVSLMKRGKGKTAFSVLLTDEATGERSVLVYRGVSKEIKETDLPLKRCKADWFYMSSLGGNLSLAKKVIRHARECGSRVAWNPGSGEIKKGFGSLKGVLPHVAVFNVNREEAETLTKAKSVTAMLRKLEIENGAVIITDGAKGAYARAGGTTWHAGTTDAESVSRTGAGDAFGSGFVASYMRDGDIAKALAVGTLNAEGVIGSVGAKQGILKRWPTKAQLKRVEVKSL